MVKRPTATGFATLGAALIAIAYGLARFAFGLFVPPIRAELGLSPDVIGYVGSLAFISFIVASIIAPLIVDHLGARNAAVLAGSFALGGLLLISQAQDATILGAGVFACGICTGLMMPALSAAVQSIVSPDVQDRVNAVMNAGTSIGVLLSVPAVLFLADAWRWAYIFVRPVCRLRHGHRLGVHSLGFPRDRASPVYVADNDPTVGRANATVRLRCRHGPH
ncbi:MAG: MFS transporter [Gammaproteobacteria bacterium]|nr:MFS transporter [Gammaproteobacteria bacterium]